MSMLFMKHRNNCMSDKIDAQLNKQFLSALDTAVCNFIARINYMYSEDAAGPDADRMYLMGEEL